MRKFFKSLLTMVIVLALACGFFIVGVYFFGDELNISEPSSSQARQAQSTPQKVLDSDVSPLNSNAPTPDSKSLTNDLNNIFNDSAQYSGTVIDSASNTTLYKRNESDLVTPASNLKLFTVTAALRELGSNQQFTTRVALSPDKSTLTIIGGGDVLLGEGASQENAIVGKVGLKTLAEQTVKNLEEKGITGPFTVAYDTSAYSEDPINPVWPKEDLESGEMTGLYPLALTAAAPTGQNGLPDQSQFSNRTQNAAQDVGNMFKEKLEQAGAKTQGKVAENNANVPVTIENAQNSTSEEASSRQNDARQVGTVLAQGQSATTAEIASFVLQESDNYTSENLGHLIALSQGKEATYKNAAESVKQSVQDIGIDDKDATLVDTSGLSDKNKVTTHQLAEVIQKSITGQSSDLRSIIDGLPTANLTGTLNHRFGGNKQVAGLLRAKTGTLLETTSLTGYVVDKDNRLLVFSFVANDFEAGSSTPTQTIDQASIKLAGCGCQGKS